MNLGRKFTRPRRVHRDRTTEGTPARPFTAPRRGANDPQSPHHGGYSIIVDATHLPPKSLLPCPAREYDSEVRDEMADIP